MMLVLKDRRTFFALVMLIVSIGYFPLETNGQRRRRRRPPPASTQAAPPQQSTETVRDAEVIGAEGVTPPNGDSATTTRRGQPATGAATSPPNDAELLRRTVEALSSQINTLTKKINDLEDQQRSTVDLERLTRAEQRAENLRAQLRDVEQKQSALRAQAEQLDYQLRPDSIERNTAGIGSLNPDEMRAQVRKQLEGEKQRVTAQIDQLEASRVRLSSALTSADAYVDRLRESVGVDNQQSTQTTAPPREAEAQPPPASSEP